MRSKLSKFNKKITTGKVYIKHGRAPQANSWSQSCPLAQYVRNFFNNYISIFDIIKKAPSGSKHANKLTLVI